MLGELDNAQIDALLHSQVIGRIGCAADHQVYVVPVTYAYDGKYIYGHTKEGLKIQLMRKNPNVCFETDQMTNMANWQSVIVQGRFEELHGDDRHKAMELLMQRIMPLLTSETSVPSHGLGAEHSHGGAVEAVVYRIEVLSKTGRFEKR